jgi:hypothetical protein
MSELRKHHEGLIKETKGQTGIVFVFLDQNQEFLIGHQKAILRDFCMEPIIIKIQLPLQSMKREETIHLANNLIRSNCHIVLAASIPLLLMVLLSKGKNLIGILQNNTNISKEEWKCISY